MIESTVEARLRGWMAYLSDSFPHMVKAAGEYLQVTTGPSLRQIHTQALQVFGAPVTRQVMDAPVHEP